MNDPLADLDFSDSEIALLVSGFYSRVKQDDLLCPMYPEDEWVGAEARLRDFLTFRFGGSNQYIQQRGQPRLGMRHAPFAIGIAERDRWLLLMKQSIEDLEIPISKQESVITFFEQVAEFLRNQ
ncbi:MAG: globin domain-containing protein [Pirellulales bacterium]|jgi:hemoglobin